MGLINRFVTNPVLLQRLWSFAISSRVVHTLTLSSLQFSPPLRGFWAGHSREPLAPTPHWTLVHFTFTDCADSVVLHLLLSMLITLIHYFISFFLDSLFVFLMVSLFNVGLVSCRCAAVTKSFTVRIHRASFIYSLGQYCGTYSWWCKSTFRELYFHPHHGGWWGVTAGFNSALQAF